MANGVEATLLTEVCEVWLKARDDDALIESQMHIAAKADILMRGLARVGIVALIDEVTGYQEDRDRDELHRILEKYIASELLPWTKRFPDEFYQEMFRLRGWNYSPVSVKRPMLVSKLTTEMIYAKLPDGVLEELRDRNPVVKDGRRRHKHHQFLTDDIGNVHLGRQLASVTTLMRASNSWNDFKRLFARAFPPKNQQLDFPEMRSAEEEGEDDR